MRSFMLYQQTTQPYGATGSVHVMLPSRIMPCIPPRDNGAPVSALVQVVP